MKNTRPPIKIRGSKFHCRKWIIDHFPEDFHKRSYCEPFAGGCSVLLNKGKSDVEIVNDIDKGITDILKALRDEPTEFIDRLKSIKYTKENFKKF